MPEKRTFQTDKAAVTGGPYSQAVIYGDMIFLSGTGAVDPVTNELKLGSIEEEARLGLENIRITLEEAGSSLAQVLKVTVYLLDMDDFDRFNAVYCEYFPENPPARVCFQAAKLPFKTKVEIEAIAGI